MVKKKIAIVGANGQLGFDLVRVFGTDFDVVEFTHGDFDITDQEKTFAKIKESAADTVINTAAFHKVEECELNPDKAFLVNTLGAYNVAKASAENEADVIYISTDYVFDGLKDVYGESDYPNPLNVYGMSKLAGELMTRIANPNHYIIRTSALFGVHQSGKGHNFVNLMLKLASDKQEIKVVNDQFTAPTYTMDLAAKLKELLEKSGPFGIYHITNGGGCSWYGFAEKIFTQAGLKPNFKSISSAERPPGAKRPRSTILLNNALKTAGIAPARPWQDALVAFLTSSQE